jgi:fructokinase
VTNVSIAKRLNCHISDLPNKSDEDPVWRSVGFYLANLCLNLTLITSVEQIVIGGGVLNRSILYDIIREEFTKLLNLYV